MLKKLIKLLPATVGRAARVWLLRYVRHVIKTRFMGPGGSTDSLKRQTGTAIRSISASPKVTVSERMVTASAGARPYYVQKHEEGFSGTEHVPAHVRRRTAKQRRSFRSKAKAAGFSAADIRANRALKQGARMISVKAHERKVNVRARRMFRHGLKETSGSLPEHARAAVRLLLQTGKIPNAASVEQLAGKLEA